MTPEERARAVAEHFGASLPPAVRPELENVMTPAITRAVNEKLARLERWATAAENRAHGKGKQGKGYNPAQFSRKWAETFRTRRQLFDGQR